MGYEPNVVLKEVVNNVYPLRVSNKNLVAFIQNGLIGVEELMLIIRN